MRKVALYISSEGALWEELEGFISKIFIDLPCFFGALNVTATGLSRGMTSVTHRNITVASRINVSLGSPAFFAGGSLTCQSPKSGEFFRNICVFVGSKHMGYHQKGLCKGYVLEWNKAQNLQKRR
jgi:hypothetical protein